MGERGAIDGPKAGNRFGCLVVLLPTAAFFIVMPDAIHVWPKPWAEPLPWLLAAVTSWLGLRWLIDGPVGALARGPRFLVWGLLLAGSVLLALQIMRSV